MSPLIPVYTSLELRAAIRLYHAKHKTPTQIFNKLCAIYGPKCISRKQVSVWCSKFDAGETNLVDTPRSGRPISERTEEMKSRIEQMIYADRRLKIREIAEEVGLSKTVVHRIVHDDLKFKKVCARWVPKELTPEHKRKRLECAKKNLERLASEPDFFENIITGDETWVHYDTPETKRQSMTWKHTESPTAKKFKKTISAKKTMASVFWDVQGVVLCEFLPKGETINANRYIETLEKLKGKIRFGRKRRGRIQAKKIILQHDNATPHTARTTKAWLERSGWDVLDHPPHSPDLAPSDFYLFGPLKVHLGGKKFETEAELQAEVQNFFKEKCVQWYQDGILKLKKRWEKCVENGGDYVEK